MAYRAPTDFTSYAIAYRDNTVIKGFGADTATVFPCPFCAAPGWVEANIVDVKGAMARGGTCGECGRSARFVFSTTPPEDIDGVAWTSAGMITLELVQTGGDDPPAWLIPRPRRVQ